MEMYLLTRLDGIVGISTIFAFIFIFIFILAIISYINDETSKSFPIVTLFIAVFFSCVALFVPTKKDAIAIWVVPKIVNNEKMQNISSNTLSIIDKYTKKWLDDLSSEKNNCERTKK